jgi:hypothetical protein
MHNNVLGCNKQDSLEVVIGIIHEKGNIGDSARKTEREMNFVRKYLSHHQNKPITQNGFPFNLASRE